MTSILEITRQNVWRNYSDSVTAFADSINRNVLPYLRRRTTPSTIAFQDLRLDASLQANGQSIRLFLYRRDHEVSPTLHFVIDLRTDTMRHMQATPDQRLANEELEILNQFTTALDRVVAKGTIAQTIYSRPFLL